MMNLMVKPTEVSAKATRRRFTTAEKVRILKEADACAHEKGAVTALLRREGLYSSHLTAWRRLREAGELSGLAAKKRGPKARPIDERDRRIAQLERELAKEKARAEKAELIVEVQKKLGELFGVKMPDDPSSTEKP